MVNCTGEQAFTVCLFMCKALCCVHWVVVNFVGYQKKKPDCCSCFDAVTLMSGGSYCSCVLPTSVLIFLTGLLICGPVYLMPLTRAFSQHRPTENPIISKPAQQMSRHLRENVRMHSVSFWCVHWMVNLHTVANHIGATILHAGSNQSIFTAALPAQPTSLTGTCYWTWSPLFCVDFFFFYSDSEWRIMAIIALTTKALWL